MARDTTSRGSSSSTKRSPRASRRSAPGGEQGVARPNLDAPAVRVESVHADAPAVLHDQVEREAPLVDHVDPLAHLGHERTLDLGARRGAAGVDHAGHAVSALAGQLQPALRIAIEQRAEGDQVVHAAGSLVDQHPDRFDVAEPHAGGQRVGQVQVGLLRVTRQRCRHAALRPAGRGLVQLRLRHDADPQSGGLGRPYRCRQPRDSAAKNEEVELNHGTVLPSEMRKATVLPRCRSAARGGTEAPRTAGCLGRRPSAARGCPHPRSPRSRARRAGCPG